MIIKNVKGGYDFLPKDQRIRNYINDTLRETFLEYGYMPIETPILCYYDMLAGKYNAENDILKEIYKLTDQGDRKLGLRYDLTVPFAKFIALNKNTLKMPFKRYEIAKVFRDGPVKVGRDREFTQCDVDVVGISGSMIEAELLSLYSKAFAKLGLEITIKYNSRKLISGLVKNQGLNDDSLNLIITIIDKKDKISNTEFIKYLSDAGLSKEAIENLVADFSLDLPALEKKYEHTDNENINQGLKELRELTDYLKAIDIANICIFDPTLARGQDYYTGNVFEVYEKNGKLKGSIGGGGRYDKMITEFISDGNIYPAVGISFGLTSIFELLKERKEFQEQSNLEIYIIPINTPKESLKLANNLRDLGYIVDLEMNDRKVKKSLDYANKENIPYVIILGEDEIKNGKFKIKNMHIKEEYEISFTNLSQVQEYLKK